MDILLKKLKQLLEETRLNGYKDFVKSWNSFVEFSKEYEHNPVWKNIDSKIIQESFDCAKYGGRLYNTKNSHYVGYLERSLEILIEEIQNKQK